MSNFSQEFEEEDEEFPNTNFQQSSNGSSTPTEKYGSADALAVTVSSAKKKRNLPGNPDPDAEVIALSPVTLMARNRYVCEVCDKGFQRDQNLQLHRRGHNLPWKLKQRSPNTEVKKRVYICPEPSCVHHDPSRALGDLTGIKKHFCRKHGEKKWKCDKCSKRYAVQSDWKAHSKICGTREYRCDCGTIFSRKDSFVTHRAFCDALAEENYKVNQTGGMLLQSQAQGEELFSSSMPSSCSNTNTIMNLTMSANQINRDSEPRSFSLMNSDPTFNPNNNTSTAAFYGSPSSISGLNFMSATALLQKAAEMGSKMSDNSIAPILFSGYPTCSMSSSFGPSVHEEASFIVDHRRNVGIVSAPIISNERKNLLQSDETNGFQVGSLFDSSPLSTHSEKENNPANLLRSPRAVFMEGGIGSEKATVDFLGRADQMNGVYDHFVNH